jgi:flavodoxin I
MGRLFYGTQTGTSEGVALEIQQRLSDIVQECTNIYRAKPADLQSADFLILGGSTWGDGELTDDWADFLPQLDQVDFTGKKVALFCLGDQFSYTYNFVSSMKILYDKVLERGGEVIACQLPTDGFDFEHSEAVVNGYFVGLALDEVNEPELTPARIAAWEIQLRAALGAVAAA